MLSWTDDRADYGEVRQISIGLIRELVAVTVVHTDRNGKTRFITRYKVAELGATQHVRYKTSRGAEAVRTLHPGERMRSTSVGRRGEIDWFIVERSKPESTRTHYTIDYHRRGLATDPGCWHLPFAKVTRRSDAH